MNNFITSDQLLIQSYRLEREWRHCWKGREGRLFKEVTTKTNLRPIFIEAEASADDLGNKKKDLTEARERVAKAEQEKEDLKRKTEELERKLVEMRNEREEVEEKAKEGKANETKKLLSSVTKLLLSSFPTDQVVAFELFKNFCWTDLNLFCEFRNSVARESRKI